MQIFIQQLINGLTIGGIYALVALGYTMVYGVMKLINFAHGDLVAMGTYVGLTVMMQFGGAGALNPFGLVLVFIITIIIITTVGVLLEETAYRPLRKAPRLNAVVSALGASMVFENGMMLIWGPNIRIFPANILPSTTWNLGGVYISFIQFVILALSLMIMVALTLFINSTKTGAAIRASAIDQDAAKLMGINVNKIIVLIFIIGSSIGAVGGLFIGLYYREVYFDMGWIYGLNAFIAAILGGIGNIPGAMLGGVLIGVFNALIAGYVSSAWAEGFTFLLFIVILIFRPKGILGERVAEKV